METLQLDPEVPSTILNLKALTWMRDSHGLFDYETFRLKKNALKIISNCTLIRTETEIKVLSVTEIEPYEKLGLIKYNNSKLILKFRFILYRKLC